MTTKEKLELALKGLEKIANGECSNEEYFATRLYNKLTTPRTEPVEVKRWLHKYKVNLYSDIEPIHNLKDWVELTGTYTRPIPEPEVWEGKVFCSHKDGGWLKGLPNEWIGRRVVVEVCE